MEKKKQKDQKTNKKDSLEQSKNVASHGKAPGQVGLYSPNSLDAIRRATSEQRQDTGARQFVGMSEPQVAPQNDDLYSPIKKEKKDKEKK